MCLRSITKRIEKPTDKIVYGWKVFIETEDGKLLAEFADKATTSHGAYKTNKWYRARRAPICMPCNSYLSGFHTFRLRRDAVRWASPSYLGLVVRKVATQFVETIGEQMLYCEIQPMDVFVAQKMMILPTRRGKYDVFGLS